MKLLRHQLDYSSLSWIILTFLGGAVNAVAIRNVADWWLLVVQIATTNNLSVWQSPEAVSLLVAFGALVFAFPLGLSFLFTRVHPENKIVPPLFMQVIAFGLLFFFVYNNLIQDLGTVYIIGVCVLTAGIVQDNLIVYTFGRTITKDSLIIHSFKIHANVKQARELITAKQFRNLHNLKIIQSNEDSSSRLKTNRRLGQLLFLELLEGTQEKWSIINIVACKVQSYDIRHIREGDEAYEWAMGKIASIQDYFMRRGIQTENDSSTNADSLVSFVMNEMEGKATRLQEMTTMKRLSLIVSVAFIFASIALAILLNRIDIGVGLLAIAVALITNVVLRS
jgi:hypothetical protein